MATANLANVITFYVRSFENFIVPDSHILLHGDTIVLDCEYLLCLHLAPFDRNSTTLQPALKGALSTAASCVSVTMMSRVMLNLQERAENMRTPNGTNGSSSGGSSTYLFTSRINMSMQFNHTFTSSESGSSESGHRRPQAAARLPLATHGYMQPIQEAFELRAMTSPSTDSVYPVAPGLV